MAERATCETCLWWDRSAQSAIRDPDTTGQCRGAVPTGDDRTGLAMWPFTEDDDWCRAHEPDPDAAGSGETTGGARG